MRISSVGSCVIAQFDLPDTQEYSIYTMVGMDDEIGKRGNDAIGGLTQEELLKQVEDMKNKTGKTVQGKRTETRDKLPELDIGDPGWFRVGF